MKGENKSISKFEHRRLNLEQEKINLDKKRLRLEWFKSWTGVPLIAVLITGLLAYWGQVQKSRDNFALKSAEIVMKAPNQWAAGNKAYALRTIFSNKLPENFSDSFNPDDLPYHAPVDPVKIDRSNLLHLLVQNPSDTEAIIEFAKVLFPEDPFIKKMSQNILPADKANVADAKKPRG